MAALLEMADKSLECEEIEIEVNPEDILEEIEEDEDIAFTLGKIVFTAEPSSPSNTITTDTTCDSPRGTEFAKTKREFGNISPISELLANDGGNDDSDVPEEEIEEFGDTDDEYVSIADVVNDVDGAEKVTPEPGPHPVAYFPRISDGRSSPILAYSPSLLKSPPSNKGIRSRNSISPPSSNVDKAQKKPPRNIARMLDNISEHSSGEDEVNAVGVMMAKFKV